MQIFAEQVEMDCLEALIQRVRQYGFRMTRQRAVILKVLCGLDGHASAEKIHEAVSRHQHDVDLSTTYRTLELLRDLRILSQTDMGRGCAEYEIVTDRRHHHLVCQQCSRVIDLDNAYLAPMAELIRKDYGFEPIFDHLAVFGLCENCRDASQPDCYKVAACQWPKSR